MKKYNNVAELDFYWLPLLFFSQIFVRLGFSQKPLTSNTEWYFVFEGRAKHWEIYIWTLKAALWCILFSDTSTVIHYNMHIFFWIWKFTLMMLSLSLFSVSKICILVVKFSPSLSETAINIATGFQKIWHLWSVFVWEKDGQLWQLTEQEVDPVKLWCLFARASEVTNFLPPCKGLTSAITMDPIV